eukprot:m.406821 g.406821  ORF g.406821 m.406821 type:complete len:70 (-) comp56500_c0_seq5:6-215(-)
MKASLWFLHSSSHLARARVCMSSSKSALIPQAPDQSMSRLEACGSRVPCLHDALTSSLRLATMNPASEH